MSLTLLRPAGSPGCVFLMIMAKTQESKFNHKSAFQALGSTMSINIPLANISQAQSQELGNALPLIEVVMGILDVSE